MDAEGSVVVKARLSAYVDKLSSQLMMLDSEFLHQLSSELYNCAKEKKRVYLCGNGGSAANAMHLANDLLYGINPSGASALRVEALPSNSSVITCLANDIGYHDIFAHQLKVKGEPGDVLIVLSGSGNSPNIVQALDIAKHMKIKTYAIVGYDGGKAKMMADYVLHTPIDDMQICEDLQLVVGHILMQELLQSLGAVE